LTPLSSPPPGALRVDAQLLDATADALLLVGDDGRILHANPVARRLLRCCGQTSTCVGLPIDDLLIDPPCDLGGCTPGCAQAQVAADGVPAECGRALVRTTDGQSVPVELSAARVDLDGLGLLVLTLRDEQRLARAEARIARQTEQLQVAARVDRIAARMMLKLSQRLDHDATEEMLGILADEAGYRPLAFYVYDDWDCGLELCASVSAQPDGLRQRVGVGSGVVGRAASEGVPIFLDDPGHADLGPDAGLLSAGAAVVFALPLVDGQRRVGVLTGASPTPLPPRESGWLMQLAGQLAAGLRARRRAEELQLLSAQLTERTRCIAVQNQELQRASRMKSQFLATMSHELRTPLNAVIGFSEVLRDGLLGPLSAKQAEYVGEICDGGRHLLAVINDILDLSKIEAGKLDLALGLVGTDDIVGACLAVVRDRASRGRVVLSAEVAPGFDELVADERKLRQVLINLLGNAVKFTDPGGGVRLELHREGGDAVLAVVDTGIGMDPDAIDEIFEPFAQLDSDSDRRFEGTGLGLAIVKRIVDLHGGTVQVDSQLGAGTTVTVRLPGAVSAAALSDARTRSDGRAAGALFGARVVSVTDLTRTASLPPERPPRAWVVAVEDDAPSTLAAQLSDAGFDIAVGAEPCEGWRIPSEGGADLIAVQASAIDQLGRFLSQGGDGALSPRLPVLVCDGRAEAGGGRCLGVSAVLAKPVDPEELVGLARQLTRGARRGLPPVVLAVDDNPRAVHRLIGSLEAADFMVLPAFSGQEAVALARELRPDLVVVDLDMDDLSGVDLVDALACLPATADVPVIAIAASFRSPLDDERLRARITRLLAHKRRGRPDLSTLALRLAGRRGDTP